MKKYISLIILLNFMFLNASWVNAKELNNQEKFLFKQESESAQVFKSNEKCTYVSDKEVYLMAQIVHAESRGEPFEGKIAVASVILNRLSYPEFPKSIEEVIMQKNAFSCVTNGKIDVIPDENSYNAVLEAIKGTDPTGKAVFFYNPRTATSKWMKNISKKSIKKIGNHVFFKA